MAVTMQNDGGAYMSELGFFFFFRMAVAVSSACGVSVRVTLESCLEIATSLRSEPEGSLRVVSSFSSEAGGKQTHFERSGLGALYSGSADILRVKRCTRCSWVSFL